jgi:hypothetical protein
MSSEERVRLTCRQAMRMLPDGKEDLHVFISPAVNLLIGMDYPRSEILAMIIKGDCEIGGQYCMSMNHALVCKFEGKNLFIETRPEGEWSIDHEGTEVSGPVSR